MNKKIIVIILSLILIFTLTLVPVTSFPVNNYSKNSIKSQEISNEVVIKNLLDKIINKINNNENPENILKNMISLPEIRENIEKLSDEYTLNMIDLLLSNKSVFHKILQLHKYSNRIENERNELDANQFEDELINIISNDFKSVKNISIFEKMNISPQTLEQLELDWYKYLEKNDIKSIFLNYSIDPIIFILVFSITIFIWGFIYGFCTICIPEIHPIIIMLSEALVIGLAGSFIMATLICSDIPIINSFVSNFCNIFFITEEQFIGISASLVSLVIIACYILAWNSSLLIQGLGAGLMVVLPPILAAIASSIEYYP